MKKYYRVCHKKTLQGLWYDYSGDFTGFIHDKFNFCLNNGLVMDFDPELVGWLSATDNLEDLYKWFTKEDIIKLQEHGWFIHVFLSDEVKFYERFQHQVIKQDSAKLLYIIDSKNNTVIRKPDYMYVYDDNRYEEDISEIICYYHTNQDLEKDEIIGMELYIAYPEPVVYDKFDMELLIQMFADRYEDRMDEEMDILNSIEKIFKKHINFEAIQDELEDVYLYYESNEKYIITEEDWEDYIK